MNLSSESGRRPWLILGVAPLLCLAIYWPAFQTWFQQDDFAWLGLLRDVREGKSLVDALFHPSQHGTWRPLGERAFYLLFSWMFGWESWPMRIAVFATQIASLALISRLMLRITGSNLAAVLAPVFWIANSKLVIAMTSSGAYIHVLCALCLLLALHAAVCERWGASWIAFLLGFGAMETNVVFPALLTLYCVLYARRNLRRVLWFWLASIVYFALNMKFAPKMSGGSYAMHWDASILQTLASYWEMAFRPENLAALTGLPDWLGTIGFVLIGGGLLAFTLAQAVRRQFHAVLFLGWFAVLLGPVLPLAGHVTGYYLTAPLAALGMLGGWAFARGWDHGPIARISVCALAALYLVPMIAAGHAATRWWQQRSLVAEHLVRTVRTVHEGNPGKIIVLEGTTSEQFWAAVAHYPFVEHAKTYVFLAPATRSIIEPHPESGVKLDEFFLEPGEAEKLRARGGIVDFHVP